MRYALRVDPDTLDDARIAQIETRLSMLVLALPTLRGLALGLFVAGSAAQAYAVWRMPGVSTA